MLLHGLRILLAYPEQLPDEKQQAQFEEVRRQAHALGVCVVQHCHDADILVAESVLTPLYQVPMETFRLEPLAGLKVSITGFVDPKQRQRIPEQIKAGGAIYTADLHKDATHLVALHAGGSKFKYAKQWGIQIVSEQWVTDCLARGMRLDEARYYPPPPPNEQRRAGGAVQPTPQGATPATAPTAPAPLPSAMPATAPATAPATRSQAGRATGSGAPPSVGPSADAQRVARPTAVEQPSGSTGAGTAPRQPVMPVQQRSNEECLFLDCVHFHCVGWSESEMLKVRELAAEGGAIREPDLVPRVTHVIVGLEPAGDQLQALRDHMAEWREHVRVVKLQWLRDAVAARACIEPSPEQCFTVAQLMPQKSMALGNTLTSVPSQPARQGLGLGRAASSSSLMLPPGPAPAAMTFAELAAPELSRSMLPPDVGWGGDTNMASDGGGDERPLDPLKPLGGMWFTTVAMGREEAVQAEELIRRHGGMLFTGGTIKATSNTDPSCILAMCPHSLPPHRVQELERSCPDFRHVHPDNRVTLYWLTECLGKGKRLPAPFRLQPGYSPLPHLLPMSCVQGLSHSSPVELLNPPHRFSSKRLKPASMEGIKKLVSILGAEYTDNIDRHNTHVFMNNFMEDTYKPLLKWGCLAVRPQWLLDMAAAGRAPNPWEPRYRPEGEAYEVMCRMQEQVQNRMEGRLAPAATQTLQLNMTQAPQPAQPRCRPPLPPQPLAPPPMQAQVQAVFQPTVAATSPLEPELPVQDRTLKFSYETGFAVEHAGSGNQPGPPFGSAAAGSSGFPSASGAVTAGATSGMVPGKAVLSPFADPAAQEPHQGQQPALQEQQPSAQEPIGSAEAMPPPRMKLQLPQMPGATTGSGRNMTASGQGSSGASGLSGRRLSGSTGARGTAAGAGGDENAGVVAAAAAQQQPAFPAPVPLAPRAGNGTSKKALGKSPKLGAEPHKAAAATAAVDTSGAAPVAGGGVNEVGSGGVQQGGQRGSGAGEVDTAGAGRASGVGHQESKAGAQMPAATAAAAADDAQAEGMGGEEEEEEDAEDGSIELIGLLNRHKQQMGRRKALLDGSASQMPGLPLPLPQLHVHASSVALSGRDPSHNTSGNSRGTAQLEGDVTSAKQAGRRAPKRAQPAPPPPPVGQQRKSKRLNRGHAFDEEQEIQVASQAVDYDPAAMQTRTRGAQQNAAGRAPGSDSHTVQQEKAQKKKALMDEFGAGGRGSGRAAKEGGQKASVDVFDLLKQ